MAMMLPCRYDALRLADAADESARTSAEVVARYGNRFSKIGADPGIVKWMVGFNLVIGV